MGAKITYAVLVTQLSGQRSAHKLAALAGRSREVGLQDEGRDHNSRIHQKVSSKA